MLPPNARRIKRARDIGQHPDEITIVYSSRWCARQYREDAVIVLADDYRRGEYDAFSWVAGVPVIALNHDRDEFEFARVVADVASWTAPVHAGPFERWGDWAEASLLMWAMRWPKAGQEWPDHWSDAKDRAYAQRAQRYQYVQQRRAQGLRA